MNFQFMVQKVGNIYGRCAIETGVQNAGGMVVVRDGLDGKAGDAPQPQQVRAYLGVRGSLLPPVRKLTVTWQ